MDFDSWKTGFKFGEKKLLWAKDALENEINKINNKINLKRYYFSAIYNKKINLQKV